MRLLKAVILFVLIFTVAVASWGADQEPASLFGRLGSRSAGLGGAGAVLPGTADSVYSNPAGLYSIAWPDVSIGLGVEPQADRPELAFAGALPLGPTVFGLGAAAYSSSALRANTYLFSLAFPFSSDGKMIMGLTGKILQEQSGSFSGNASGGGVDIGLFYPLWDTDPSMAIRLGLAVIDAQTTITDNNDQYRLPSIFRIGLSWNLTPDRVVLLGFDSQQSQNALFDSYNTARAGLEQRLGLSEDLNASFRLGYLKRLDQDGMATLGLGFEYQDWRFDYALQLPAATSQAFHQISLSWGFHRKTAAQNSTSTPAGKSGSQAAATPTPEVSLFSALDRAAKEEDSSSLIHEEKKPVSTATPAPVRATPTPADEEEYTYHVPLPKGPADQESAGGTVPEMPASFTASVSSFNPKNNSFRLVNQDLRLHVVVNPFSPNHNGYQDKTMFVGSLDSDKYRFVRWVLDIVRDSRLLISFSGGSQLPRNLEWNGSDRQGRILADGTYQAVLRIFDENDLELTSDTQQVTIRSKPLNVDLKAPETSQLTGGSEDRPLEFSLPSMRGSREWQFSIVSPSGKRVFEKSGGDLVPQTFRWNPRVKGKPAPAGRYRAVVSFRDEIGIKTRAEAEFAIQYASCNAALNAEPALFQPVAKGGKGVTFHPSMTGDVKIQSWTLTILNDQDTPVKTLSGEGMPAAALAWDGTNEKGEPVAGGGVFHGTLAVQSVLGTEAEAASDKVQCDIGAYTGEKALAINLVRVTFQPGSMELGEEARKSLGNAADTLVQYKTKYQLQITGHCDNQETSKEKEMELSRGRAQAVRDFMIQRNLPADLIQAIGRGSTQPLSQDATDEARAKNRRVEILLYAK